MPPEAKVQVRVVVPEALPFTKVVERTPEALAEELETIARGFLAGMPGLPIQITLEPVKEGARGGSE